MTSQVSTPAALEMSYHSTPATLESYQSVSFVPKYIITHNNTYYSILFSTQTTIFLIVLFSSVSLLKTVFRKFKKEWEVFVTANTVR